MNILDFIYPYTIRAHRSNAKSPDDCKENVNMHIKDRTVQILGANWN
jgi:hypothetical protein